MMKKGLLIICLMLVSLISEAKASLPDSLLTISKSYVYNITSPDTAQAILDAIRERQSEPAWRIDFAEGDLNFNMRRYLKAVSFFERAKAESSLRDSTYLQLLVLKRLMDCHCELYHADDAVKAIYALKKKAKSCGDKAFLSMALFTSGKLHHFHGHQDQGYASCLEALEMMKETEYLNKHIELRTSDWIGEIYAGAEMANVKGDVSLTLTSGKFGRVFGGNKTSGILDGSITVNIDENGDCDVPIVIGELYGGGNMAAYSIYGYEGDAPRTKAQWDALTAEQKAAIGLEKPHASPVVNVHGFTSIGNIFGGGYGVDADMYGSPTVNINEVLVVGNKAYKFSEDNSANKPDLIDNDKVKLYDHDLGKMGVIGNVFGGGNAALVDGNTTVNIATEENVYVVKLVDVGNPVNGLYKRVKNETTGEVTYTIQDTNDKAVEGSNYYQLLSAQGADIRGNVYGGGNQAEVTGDTNVVIGRKDASTSTSPARASEPPSESQPVTP